MLTEQEALELLDNVEWRLSHLYKIKTKEKKLQILVPNKVQEHYRRERTNKDIILKARQLGVSTEKLIEYLDDTISHRNTNTAIIAHRREKVQSLFEIVKLAFEKLPSQLKPRVSYDNRNELTFPDLNSKIYVTMDTRAEMVHNLHISEIDFMRNPESILLAALESVPIDGRISIESTANGIGILYDLWTDEKSEFKKHFYNWLWDKSYRIKTDKGFDELREEYKQLAQQYGLIPDAPERFEMDKEQLSFYISKIRRHRKMVVQEYPLTDLEAFITSGRTVFSANDLQKHQPIEPLEVRYGNLQIWEYPLKGFFYTIGVDTSEGLGQDNAIIDVLNAYTGYQAAEMATNDIAPDELARYVILIGKYYNNGLIVPEINGSGISTLDKIKYVYGNIYQRRTIDTRTKEQRQSLGWKTTGLTKPRLVNDLEEAIREQYITINSKDTLNECKTFARTEESNKHGYGAEGSKKDDRVIALGLAYQGIKYVPHMKAPKSEAQKRLEEYVKAKKLEAMFPERTPVITARDRHKQFIRLRDKYKT